MKKILSILFFFVGFFAIHMIFSPNAFASGSCSASPNPSTATKSTTISFSFNPSQACYIGCAGSIPQIVYFGDGSSGVPSGGSSSISHTYYNSGGYTITMNWLYIVRDFYGQHSVSESTSCFVNVIGVPTPTPTPTPAKPGPFSLFSNGTGCTGSSPYVDLSWSTSNGINIYSNPYAIYRNGGFIASSFSTSYRDTVGLFSNTFYTYQIQATNSGGSAFSNTISVTTANCVPPTPIPIPTAIPTTPTQTPITYSVGGFVFEDTNENGVRDPGETGVLGATINICTGNVSCAIPTLASTTSDSTGHYQFDGLLAGTYSIDIISGGRTVTGAGGHRVIRVP